MRKCIGTLILLIGAAVGASGCADSTSAAFTPPKGFAVTITSAQPNFSHNEPIEVFNFLVTDSGSAVPNATIFATEYQAGGTIARDTVKPNTDSSGIVTGAAFFVTNTVRIDFYAVKLKLGRSDTASWVP